MRALVLGLVISTAAFGGSTLYLWQQLEAERANSAQAVDTASGLNKRLLELQGARTAPTEPQRMGAAAVTGSRGTADSEAPRAMPAPGAPVAGNPESAQRVAWSGPRPDQSPAFRKMIRSQMRASNKRLYAD